MARQRERTQEPAKESPSQIGKRETTIHNKWMKWLFLTGNQFVIAEGVLVGLFSVISGLTLVDSGPFSQFSPLFYVFGRLIGGNLTLITVVISVNQRSQLLSMSKRPGPPIYSDTYVRHLDSTCKGKSAFWHRYALQ